MSYSNLPRPRRMWRWEPRLKIVLALRDGSVTMGQVVARCRLSAAEVAEWQERYDRLGVEGLKCRRSAQGYQRGEVRAL